MLLLGVHECVKVCAQCLVAHPVCIPASHPEFPGQAFRSHCDPGDMVNVFAEDECSQKDVAHRK